MVECLFCSKTYLNNTNLNKHIRSNCNMVNLQDPEKRMDIYKKANHQQILIIQNQIQTQNNITNINNSVDKNEDEDNKEDNLHYIYVLREREFIKTNEQIYKIGKTTKRQFKRFNQYPNGSKLEFMMSVKDCHHAETKVKEILELNFIKNKEIGNEYYQGDILKIIDCVYKICISS